MRLLFGSKTGSKLWSYVLSLYSLSITLTRKYRANFQLLAVQEGCSCLHVGYLFAGASVGQQGRKEGRAMPKAVKEGGGGEHNIKEQSR